MTCEEVRAIMKKQFTESTVAERCAVVRHGAACQACRDYQKEVAEAKIKDLSAIEKAALYAYAEAICSAQYQEDIKDPEFQL